MPNKTNRLVGGIGTNNNEYPQSGMVNLLKSTTCGKQCYADARRNAGTNIQPMLAQLALKTLRTIVTFMNGVKLKLVSETKTKMEEVGI